MAASCSVMSASRRQIFQPPSRRRRHSSGSSPAINVELNPPTEEKASTSGSASPPQARTGPIGLFHSSSQSRVDRSCRITLSSPATNDGDVIPLRDEGPRRLDRCRRQSTVAIDELHELDIGLQRLQGQNPSLRALAAVNGRSKFKATTKTPTWAAASGLPSVEPDPRKRCAERTP